ncbi:hypothetical protein [Nonomuraea sp. NPDC049028]|uniref:hypothetical protein n=1 Tax=Nonomuraea sp. NPDC049028 TaxID=3364348 RepID=UPI003716CF2A
MDVDLVIVLAGEPLLHVSILHLHRLVVLSGVNQLLLPLPPSLRLKELADVLYGAADALGIDLPAVSVEVHRSNMSKLDADGRVLRRADGKVLKGPGYQPPVLDNLVKWPPTGS